MNNMNIRLISGGVLPYKKGGKALNLSPRLPKGGQRRKGGDSRG